MKASLEPVDPLTQQLTDGDELTHRLSERALAGDPIPALCGPADLMWVFGLKSSHFQRLRDRRVFDRFLVEDPITQRQWSGPKIQRYVMGERSRRQFGQKASR